MIQYDKYFEKLGVFKKRKSKFEQPDGEMKDQFNFTFKRR